MSLSEKLLLLLSRKANGKDYREGRNEWSPSAALSILSEKFPGFLEDIRGKQILDYGCGDGHQVVALSQQGAQYVLGVDPSRKALEIAKGLAKEYGVEAKVEFAESLDGRFYGRFDVVISQNSMEHYPDAPAIVGQMKTALKPRGKMLITFGPPWFAPYGSHMQFFTKVPWVNLLFSEKTVMNARRHFRQDGATRYEDVESGLNRMTVAKLERIVSQAGLRVLSRRYDCVKGVQPLGRIPALRELVVNHISLTLTRE